MGKIILEGMEFYAHHGCTLSEQKIGNRYIVDISIDVNLEEAAETDDLENTVDYGVIYQIVAEEMKKSSKLLENIGKRIVDQVVLEFPQIVYISVAVAKQNPPIGGICEKAKVIMEYKM